MLKKKKSKDTSKAFDELYSKVVKQFAKEMEAGHYCVFKKRKITMKDIVNDEKQFRMCMWCRINNLMVGVSSVSAAVKALQKPNKGESRPNYIG